MLKPGYELKGDSKILLGGSPAGAADNAQVSRAERQHTPDDFSRERLFELRSALTLRTLHADCARHRPEATVRLGSGRTVAGVLHWKRAEGLYFESSAPLPAGALQVRLLLHGLMIVVHAQVAEARDERSYLLEGARWFTFDRRAASRHPLSKGKATLHWAAASQHDGLMSGDVCDLSPGGMQLLLDDGVRLPEHEPFPASLQVAGREIPCVAQLRQRIDGRRAGLSVRTAPHDDALASVYLGQRFPRLCARHEVAPAALREMLERSGYLALRDGGGVSDAWCALRLPSDVSWDFVYRAADGAVLGLASATRVYAHTWLFHQLATVGGHRESVACRKMLYGLACAVPNIYSGERAFGLAYFDLAKRWHRLFFEEFTHWIDDLDQAIITKLDRFEHDAAVKVELPAAPGYSVAPASERELVLATALVRRQLPRLLSDALNLEPWSLREPQLIEPRQPYQRTREVLVLRGPGGVEGVALCEQGSSDVSLFGILNMAHVFVPGGDRALPVTAQRLLLAELRAFYEERGVRDPIVVAPHATLQAEQEPGTRLVETMGAVAMASSAMRQWENFCQFHFGHQSRSAD